MLPYIAGLEKQILRFFSDRCSQIGPSPLMDDSQSTYPHKIGGKNPPEKLKLKIKKNSPRL
jgi:hypothetical protein